MTKIFAAILLATTQLPLFSFAWAPAHTAPYNTLPKTLEFAKRAWFFPQSETVSSPISPRRLSEEHQHRMLPWTHQQHSTLLSRTSGGSNDCYFFDGFPGSATEWPTHQVSHTKKRTSKLQMAYQEELFSEADFYNDDTGAFVSWVSKPASPASKACESHYFDDTGRGTCWTSALLAAKKSLAEMKPPKVDLCENYYYDGTGDLLCWVSQ